MSNRDWQRIPTPKKAAFLAAYAATCTVTKAAEAAGMNRASHYDWLKSDPEYKAKFAEVQEQGAQVLEDEAISARLPWRREAHHSDGPLLRLVNRAGI